MTFNNLDFNNPLECGFKAIEKLRSSLSVYIYFHIILFIIIEMEIIFFFIEIKNFNIIFS